MIKYIIAAVAGAIAGGFAGNSIAHRLEEPHHHPRAVMHLLGFHRDRLDAASQAGNCATVEFERARLTSLQQEIQWAFPKAYAQEAGFKKDADALGTVLQSINNEVAAAGAVPAATATTAAPAAAVGAATSAPGSCPNAAAQYKKIYDTCEDCHKVYDPE